LLRSFIISRCFIYYMTVGERCDEAEGELFRKPFRFVFSLQDVQERLKFSPSLPLLLSEFAPYLPRFCRVFRKAPFSGVSRESMGPLNDLFSIGSFFLPP